MVMPRHYSSIIGSVGRILGAEWFSNSQRSQLKRYGSSCRTSGATVALNVLAQAGAPLETMAPSELKNWIWLIYCMAVVSSNNRDPHNSSRSANPGFVLQSIGYSESKLSRLLDARDERFDMLLAGAAQNIGRCGKPLNWAQVAPLILAKEPEGSWAEITRIAIARDFMLASFKSAQEARSAQSSSEEFAAAETLS